jgi:hypothetical protein
MKHSLIHQYQIDDDVLSTILTQIKEKYAGIDTRWNRGLNIEVGGTNIHNIPASSYIRIIIKDFELWNDLRAKGYTQDALMRYFTMVIKNTYKSLNGWTLIFMSHDTMYHYYDDIIGWKVI